MRADATARPVSRFLFTPVNAASLAAFRIGFGLLIAAEICWEWAARSILVEERPIRFAYDGFGWLGLLPPGGGTPFLCLMIAICLGVASGCCFRFSAIAFTLGYTWMFLLDRAYFNNHNYLICMLGGWLAVGDAHRRWSVDALLRPALRARTVPRWQVAGPIAQIGVSYVFGGVAKLNPDWLRGEPMRHFLHGLRETPVLSVLADQPPLPLVFAWCGMLFDLLIVPALLWGPTRLPAIAAMAFFHVVNANMFSIGIFPWLSMAAIVLFLPAAWIERMVGAIHATGAGAAARAERPRATPARGWQAAVAAAFVVWFAVQTVVPLRRFLLPGNVGWTREGFYFAWTMKLDHKSAFVGFHACDPTTGACHVIDHAADLTAVQRLWLPADPHGIADYARYVKRRAAQSGRQLTIVCDAVASLNGRPYQYMIDPAVDVGDVPARLFRPAPWIVPLAAEEAIGQYVDAAAKDRIVMALIHQTRVQRGIFPTALAGIAVRDTTPAAARPPAD